VLLLGEHKPEPEETPAARVLRRFMAVSKEYEGQIFIIGIKACPLLFTPLPLASWKT
jgi:hypothetical protein